MIFFLVIGLAIVIYSRYSYTHAFIIFLVYRLFLSPNIAILNISSLPLVSLDLILCLYWAGDFYIFKKKKINSPFKNAIVFLIMSLLLCSLFSITGPVHSITKAISKIAQIYLLIDLTWSILNKSENYILLVKYYVCVFLVAALYLVFEARIEYNPYLEYIISLGGEKNLIMQYDITEFRGYRAQSIFTHAIGASVNFVVFGIAVLYLFFNNKNVYNRLRLSILPAIVACLCIGASLLTKCRTQLMYLIVTLPLFVISIKMKNVKYYVLLIVAIFLALPFLSQYTVYFTSIFQENKNDTIGGSSLNMRLDQLGAAFELFSQRPLFGWGIKSFYKIPDWTLASRLLGGESVWIWLLVEQGLVGTFAFIKLIARQLKIGMIQRNYYVLFSTLGIVITMSVSSTPGYVDSLFYSMLLASIKFRQDEIISI